MNNLLIYDCEILAYPMPKGISIVSLEPGPIKMDGFEYCHDWRDFSNMGISAIGFYSDGEITATPIPIIRFPTTSPNSKIS